MLKIIRIMYTNIPFDLTLDGINFDDIKWVNRILFIQLGALSRPRGHSLRRCLAWHARPFDRSLSPGRCLSSLCPNVDRRRRRVGTDRSNRF